MIIFIIIFILLIIFFYNLRKIKIISDYQKNYFNKDNVNLKYIPKKIFQICSDKLKLNKHFLKNIEYIKRLNPDWEYRLFDNNDIINYIQNEYGDYILSIYNKINPKYAAARADFFRYLLLYKEGGAYFDLKSAMKYPLNKILLPNDEYILTHWISKHHSRLLNNKYGEYQQWHIICRPFHPFLKSVIDKVIKNIIQYDKGAGKYAVLKITGPIAYTQAIDSIKELYNYREIEFDEMLGLIYNNLSVSHINLFSQTHYSKLTEPVII